MTRLLLSVLIGSIVFTATYALASRAAPPTLTQTRVEISACQAAELHLSFAPVTTSSTAGSWNTEVTVSGIDPRTCGNARIELVVLHQASVLASATDVLGRTSKSHPFLFPGVDPAIVTGVSVAIAG
jgi:hypothetical protein